MQEAFEMLQNIAITHADRPETMRTHEYAYQHLRNMIMLGAIKPGKALTIRGLAATFSISPTPVREALRRLSSEGAVQVLDNRRIMVPAMTPDRFAEIFALRIMLETHAAARACTHISEKNIDDLTAIDIELDAAVAIHDRERALFLNQRFHRALYQVNPDQIVMPMIESVWLQLGPFLGIAMEHVHDLYTVDRHAEALDALRKRDVSGLKAAIAADIRDGVGGLDRASIEKLFSLMTTF
jgi:DNA-binding GntR family transcriptional regulator